MAAWDLPTSVEAGGAEWEVRSDYRAVLDVMEVLADAEIGDDERALCALSVFYPDFGSMPREAHEEAVARMMWFVAGGEEGGGGPRPRLMDWSQDFPLIAAPVNRVLGCEVRSVPYLHWWTFLAAYREIGDCTFAQVVAIRRKRARGERLDKADERFYRENRALVDLRRRETEAEAAVFGEWV